MRSFIAVGEKVIGTNGFFLFGALTSIMAILKLTVITDWSWWRVSLPIAIFVGFNMVYILVGFIYLSLIEAVLIFADLSVADLFLYWSRIGPTLDGSE